MDLVRQAILEKIARDAGFDRAARRQGPWLVVGSSHFGEEVLLMPVSQGGVAAAALTDRPRPHSPASISGITKALKEEPVDFGGEQRDVWAAHSDAALGALLAIV